MRKMAIIPARSGSKGLIDKNIKELCGKPLMAYTIEAAIKSNVFDCVHVSTDSEVYARIAKEYGADVPFLRSKEYAADTTTTWDTVKHVLDMYADRGEKFDFITVLQPTSPLRTEEDILNAYKLFCEKNASSVVGVCEMENSPSLTNTLPENLSLEGFIDMGKSVRRQDLKTFYRVNGGIYMLKKQVLNNLQELYGKDSYAYIMEQSHSVDIDTEWDFKFVEFLMTY